MSGTHNVGLEKYHVGIVCALPNEMAAASAMLDEDDGSLQHQDLHDNNSYVLGRMSGHNVVIACLPAGIYGTNAAATVAKDMLRTFTSLRFGLLVGIGGGVPNIQAGRDIRLGDVVVSQPDGTFGGVVQYDVGKNRGDGEFVRRGALNSPPHLLLTALSRLKAKSGLEKSQLHKILDEAYRKYPSIKGEGYLPPGTEMDRLQCSRCQPTRWWWFLWLLVAFLCPLLRCDGCENGVVRRSQRGNQRFVIHYGTIASGNQVVKRAPQRDRLGQVLGALCVEMEAAGLMNSFSCIVIRGICDYADSYKNDAWQNYAALRAAGYAKDFLQYVTPAQTSKQKRIQDVVG